VGCVCVCVCVCVWVCVCVCVFRFALRTRSQVLDLKLFFQKIVMGGSELMSIDVLLYNCIAL
jgi:hypothetical protein